jgi:hypothetical protein
MSLRSSFDVFKGEANRFHELIIGEGFGKKIYRSLL